MNICMRLLRSVIVIIAITPLVVAYTPYPGYPFVSYKVSGTVVDSIGHGVPGHTMTLYFKGKGVWHPATSDTNFSYRLVAITDSTGRFWLRAVLSGYYQPLSDLGVTLSGSNLVNFRLLYHLADYAPIEYPSYASYHSSGCKSCENPAVTTPPAPQWGRVYDFPDTTITLNISN